MQIEQRFELPLAPAAAWPAFKDVALLVDCLPGASLTGPAVDGELPLRFDVKLGPISAGFVGSGRVVFDDAARAGRLEGQAIDKRSQSRVKGVAAFSLQAEGEATRVEIVVDYSLSGTLAQFSRGGIVRELASALTAQFAANLAGALAQASVPGEPVDGAQGGPGRAGPSTGSGRTGEGDLAEALHSARDRPVDAPAATRAAATPLSAWSLIRQVITARWRGLWRRRPAAGR